jgi:hypothetical protein
MRCLIVASCASTTDQFPIVHVTLARVRSCRQLVCVPPFNSLSLLSPLSSTPIPPIDPQSSTPHNFILLTVSRTLPNVYSLYCLVSVLLVQLNIFDNRLLITSLSIQRLPSFARSK